MTQPTDRRFVMEPRLDSEIVVINDALDLKVDLTDSRLTDTRTPTDNSVTSAKILNGTIINEDINASAAIAVSKLAPISLDNLSDVVISGAADKQTLQYELATTSWKNKVASGGVTVNSSAPTTPIAGDAWFDSNDGTLYVYYTDTDTSQWVQVQANSALEGTILARLGSLESGSLAVDPRLDMLEDQVTNLQTANATINKSGLVPVIPPTFSTVGGSSSRSGSIVTFSGATRINLNTIFTESFQKYRIIMLSQHAGAGTLLAARVSTGGVATSDSTYTRQGLALTNGTAAAGSWYGTAEASVILGYSAPMPSTNTQSLVLEVFAPAVSSGTSFQYLTGGMSTTYSWVSGVSNYATVSTPDGIQLYVTSGTFSGTIQVFGYNA